MNRLLPALHEGHAPFTLHQAFADAIDAFEDWQPHEPAEPLVAFEGVAVPISAVFGRMRSCDDRLPARLADPVADIATAHATRLNEPATFADAATLLRTISVERLRRSDLWRLVARAQRTRPISQAA